jgi:ATP-binding cassette subfamily C protein CydD
MIFDHNLMRQTRAKGLALQLTIVSGILCGGFIILQAIFIAELINAVFLDRVPLEFIKTPIFLLVLVIILRFLTQFFTDWLAARIGIDVKEKLRSVILQKTIRLGPVYTSGEKKGEINVLLTDGIEALDPYFSQYIPQLILAAFVPVVIVISIFPVDPLSFFILLVTAPLLPIFMYLLGSQSEKSTQNRWHQLLKSNSYFYDTVQGLLLLKSLNQSHNRGQAIQKHNEEYQLLTMNVLKLTFLSSFVLEFIATISTAVIAVEIGLRLLSGNLDFVSAMFVLLLAPEFYLPLRQLGLKFHAGMSGRTASKKLFELLSERDIEASDSFPLVIETHEDIPQSLSGTMSEYFPIKFENVSANYPGMDAPVLKQIDLRIDRNEQIALVGRSGVGKTSLSYIFMRLLPYTEGSVYFGGKSLLDISEEELSNLVSWVPQSPYLFSGSIIENISLFQKGVVLSEIKEAAHKAQLDNLIKQLPNGLDSQVGERGNLISIGQAQRIAIARAYYRNTPILVMDEPTSSVDPETEFALLDSLQELKNNKTVIMIAHRLSTIEKSNQILLLEDGRIREQGRHAELMKLRKQYYQLYIGAASV